jgi:hypothetical protein
MTGLGGRASVASWDRTSGRPVDGNTRHAEAFSGIDAGFSFLSQAGAPLDNNLVERSLKKAILHRKNALFYKTQNGASVGDLYMTLIHTYELNDANAFEHLTALQQHADEVAASPESWLLSNYRNAITAE